jgi:phototropin
MSKSLEIDIKHITLSLLPGLDTVFLESACYIEQRIAKEIYPAFVKSQLAMCTSLSLSAEHIPAGPNDYPGLGDSFCLTDPHQPDNPIAFASDSFVSVTGYSRPEIIARNCRFLQGALTDRAAIGRIREAIALREESVELILNYRKDGQPFWNLLYTCPLFDATGKLRFYLGGQINVSETIGSYKDVLRTLNNGSIGEPGNEDKPAHLGERTPRQAGQPDKKARRPSSVGSREGGRVKTSKRNFFKTFRKQPYSATSSPTSRRSPELPSPTNASTIGLEQTLNSRSAMQKLSLSSQIESFYSTYSQFIILEHSPGYSSSQYATKINPDPLSRKKGSSSLSVAFCSRAALEALGLGMAADVIMKKDIFTVLAEHANSPSVTKSFKTTVRERVLRDGKAATLDLMVHRLMTKSSTISLDGLIADDHEKGRDGKQSKSNSPKGSAHVSKLERLVSYWTPLKDDDSDVCWVVLVISSALTPPGETV